MAAKRTTKRSTTKKGAARGGAKKKAVARKSKPAKAAARRARPAAKPAAKAKKAPAPKRAASKPPPAPPKAEAAASAAPAAAAVTPRFVWVDLATKDLGAAQSFYKSLLGWGTKDAEVPPPMNKYTMFNSGGEEFGGLIPLPDPNAPIQWLPYVWVEDVDRVSRRAEELGGKVLMQPADIPNVGRFSVVADPSGGVVSPMSFVRPPRAQPRFGLWGPVSWCELLTDDVGKAGPFYQELFGWARREQDMGPGGKYTLFKSGDRDVGGMAPRQPPLEHTAWVTYFAVEDVDAKTEAAKAAGASQVVPPSDIPNVGRFSWLRDPQGALFGLFKGNPPPPSA
jgi:uncharacterized protein